MSPTQPIQIMDLFEPDVIIVGAGAAGLTAAIASAEVGASTVVVEKAPSISKTNTSRSGGNFTIATMKEEGEKKSLLSFQETVEEALNFSGGNLDPALILIWAQNIDSTIDWITKLGLRWGKYHFTSANHIRNTALGKGAGLNKQLLSIAQSKGVKILFNTRGMKLLTNDLGNVIGIRCQMGDGLKDFRSRAVVMATSGFQANKEMLARYFGSDFASNVRLTGSPFSTGDGHIMVEEVGGQLINMNQSHGRSIGKHWHPGSAGTPSYGYDFFPYSILVNKLGKRFVDESLPTSSINCSIAAQPGQEAALIFDEKTKAIKPAAIDKHRPIGSIMKFNTLEELSGGIGFSYNELKNTIEELNNAVSDGETINLDVPKRKYASRIENPPFYVIYPIYFGFNCTLGGPKITPKAQVMNKDNVPIPGLFACGEMIGGFYSGNFYTTPGGARYYIGNYGETTSALSICVVFGRIAGMEAAKRREQN